MCTTFALHWYHVCRNQFNQPANQPTSQQANQPTSQPANQPTSPPANQPPSQRSQPANQPAGQHRAISLIIWRAAFSTSGERGGNS